MIAGWRMKFLIVDGDVGVMYWRQSVGRYGCDRSRRILNRFPKNADAIARATIEGGSRLRSERMNRHG